MDRGIKARRVGLGLIGEVEARWAERFGRERIAELRKILEEIVVEVAPHAVPELAALEAVAGSSR